MKKIFLLLSLFYTVLSPVLAQRFAFQTPPELSTAIPASALISGGYGAGNSFVAYQGDYSRIDLAPSTWGQLLKFKSLGSYVKALVDHNYLKKVQTPYTYRILYNMKGYKTTNPAETPVVFNDTLTIGFHPDSLTAYQDIMVRRYTGFLKCSLYVTGIYELTYTTGTNPQPVLTAVSNTSLKPNFRIELGFLSQPYYKKVDGDNRTIYGFSSDPFLRINNLTSPTQAATQNYIALKWGVPVGSNLVAITPANYELEWTYVDDYKVDLKTGVTDYYDVTELKYDFTNNSTRVWLDTNFFRLPVVYNHGYLLYRVRLVRPDSIEFKNPVYSNWTIANASGLISSLPTYSSSTTAAAQYFPITTHLDDKLNWQYTVSFAEQGKYKHVMSYYDGLLKNRQSITRFNSQPNQLIATGSIYDFEGRPAITVLPTPVTTNSFSLQSGLTKNAATGVAYQAADFDTLQTSVCPGETVPTPLATNALASIYYSKLNPDTSDAQKFVPDAGGYPMVQTIFSPGYDKRVDKQGGAGDSLQIGRGHETKNDYVSAEQYADLNRMFGTEIGWAPFYSKTVTKDPNGQLSLSIADYEGRPVLSSLIGDGPDKTKHPILTNDNVADTSSLYEDLFRGNTQNIAGNTRSLNRDFFMDFTSNSKLQYIYTFNPYAVCPGKNLSVKAFYKYSIIDQCGVVKIVDTGTLGKTGLVTTVSPSPGQVRDVLLNQGSHTLDKTLTVSTDDIQAAVDSFINNPGTCLKTEPQFIKEEVKKQTYPCAEKELTDCDRLRRQMMAQMWPNAKYGKYTRYGPGLIDEPGNSSIFNTVELYFEGPRYFRYKDTCLVTLPASVWKNGEQYTNLRDMNVDSFIYIFNDTIAAALLPLHPEYCQLLGCFNDTFKTRYEAIPNAALAAQFSLLKLNDVIANDPLLPVLSLVMADADDSLRTFKGGKVWLDSIALMLAYCNCSDSTMFNECRMRIFSGQIDQGLLITPAVQAAYFEKVRPMYLANRERLKAYLVGSTANTCGPCRHVRMQLIQPPLVPQWVNGSGTVTSNSPLFPGNSIYNNTTSLDTLIYQMANFNEDSVNYYQSQSAALIGANNAAMNLAAVDSIVSHLNNCYDASPTKRTTFRNYLLTLGTLSMVRNGYFTPDHINAALSAASISKTDLCHEFLVNYDNLMSSNRGSTQKNCKSDGWYSDARQFLQRLEVYEALTAASTSPVVRSATLASTLPTNTFEAALATRVGTNAVNITAIYQSARKLYRIQVTGSNTDTVFIWLKGSGTGIGAACDGVFNGIGAPNFVAINQVKCISASNFSADGYIGDFAFLVEAERHYGSLITTCTLLGWDNAGPEMAGTAGTELSTCLPCTEMRKLYRDYNDQMTAYGQLGTDHPYYTTSLRNFMNFRTGKVFSETDYTDLVKGCALADSMMIGRYIGYARIVFSSDGEATDFLNSVPLNPSTAGIYLAPNLFYSEPGGEASLFFDLMGVPKRKLQAVVDYINSYGAGVVSHNVNEPFSPTGDPECLGWVVVEGADPFDPTSPTTIPVWPTAAISNALTFDPDMMNADVLMGPNTATGYVPHKFYPIYVNSGSTDADISLALHDLEKFIYDTYVPAQVVVNREHTVNSDYLYPQKKDYLNYAWSLHNYPLSQVLDSLKAENLRTNVLPGSGATYIDPAHPGIIRNLYVSNNNGHSNGLDKVMYMLNKTRTYLSGNQLFFTSGSQHRAVVTDSLDAYRCSDGAFWYRYFGAGDTLWNVFIKFPPYIASNDYANYVVSGVISIGNGNIYPGFGNGVSRNFKVVVHRSTGNPVPLVLDGYADFTVGHNLVLKDVMLSVQGNNLPPSVTSMEADTINNCERERLIHAISLGKMKYFLYMDSVRRAVYNGFYAHVMGQVGEQLFKTTADQKFNYTLYYYDRAGNLISTIPPDGVKKVHNSELDDVDDFRALNDGSTLTPEHLKKTESYYNTLNQVVMNRTPDGGQTDMYYDNAGRLVFSQNAKQRDMGDFTYNLYDGQGRQIETGQARLGCPYFTEKPYYPLPGSDTLTPKCGFKDLMRGVWTPKPAIVRDLKSPGTLHEHVISHVRGYTRQDVVRTDYDDTVMNLENFDMPKQENLRKRISTLRYYTFMSPGANPNIGYSHGLHYSYDPEGNVKSLVQDMPALKSVSQQFKRIDYDYDVISGKINMLSYNRGRADQYYHRYRYDDDNRLTLVETSNDGMIWNRDAAYQYYQHGPLARVSQGDLRVQGIDYAYTIQGWLKAVNGDVLNPALDMGKDAGRSPISATITANDASATTLDYFNGDYRPIGLTPVAHLQTQNKGLYNGNIARQTTAIIKFQTLTANYQYDQLNRIKAANYAAVDPAYSTLTANIPLTNINSYQNRYSYDADGNLEKLVRYGVAPTLTGTAPRIDTFAYRYETLSGIGKNKNKLFNVNDYADDIPGGLDLKKHTDATLSRITYDKIGNVVQDRTSDQDLIEWNLYGKATHMQNKGARSDLYFTYDALGNRVSKSYKQRNDTSVHEQNEYYVRDAQGNILAVYNQENKYKVVDNRPRVVDATLTTMGVIPFVEGILIPLTQDDGGVQGAVYKLVETKGQNMTVPVSYYLHDPETMDLMLDAGNGYHDALADWETANNVPVMGEAIKNGIIDGDEKALRLLTTTLSTENKPEVMVELMDILYDVSGEMGDFMAERLSVEATDPEVKKAQMAESWLNMSMGNPEEMGAHLSDMVSEYPSGSLQFLDNALRNEAIRGVSAQMINDVSYGLMIYGKDSSLRPFFDSWGAAEQVLKNVTDVTSLRQIAFGEEPVDYLSTLITQQGAALANDLVMAGEGMNPGSYMDYLALKVSPTVKTEIEAALTYEVMKSRVHWLGEHDLYGSSRLGIKKYWQSQYYNKWDYVNLVSGKPFLDSARLQTRTPWYSGETRELIKPEGKDGWGNFMKEPFIAQQSLGQKQYEQTNHLGNVLATVSDKRSERMSSVNDSVVDYHPAIKAAYDYYPYGQLMPGRFSQDASSGCMDITQTVMTAKWIYDDMYYDPPVVRNDATAIPTLGAGAWMVIGNNPGDGADWTQPAPLGEQSITFVVEELTTAPYRASVSEYQQPDGEDSALVELGSIDIDGTGVFGIDFTASKPNVTVSLVRGEQNGGEEAKVIFVAKAKKLTYVQENVVVRVCPDNDGYRYGYNGKTKDNEVAGIGNWQDYGMRMLNTRIGRFPSVDPLTSKYPWYTPYQFAGNQPIESIDLDGLEEYHAKDGSLIGKYGLSTEIRVVYDDQLQMAREITSGQGRNAVLDAQNNMLYNEGSAPTSRNTDQLATDWAKRYNGPSIRADKEYSSNIFLTSINGVRVASYDKPHIGPKPSIGEDKVGDNKWTPMGNSKRIAHIHTHGAYSRGYTNYTFSEADIASYLEIRIPGYLATPAGTLLLYDQTLGGKQKTPISTEIPSDPNSVPAFERANEIPPRAPNPVDISNAQ